MGTESESFWKSTEDSCIFVEKIVKNILTAHLLSRHGGTKLWKDAATVRAIGVPNIAQKRCQPPPGEVGGAKLKRHFHRTP